MSAETSVTVTIGSEVSAQVLPNASNTMATITEAVSDPSFWDWIVHLFNNLFL